MSMRPIHKNGTISTSDVVLSFGQTIKRLEINNTHASNNLLVTFDDTNYFTVRAETILKLDVKVTSVTIKGSGAGTTYEVLGMTG